MEQGTQEKNRESVKEWKREWVFRFHYGSFARRLSVIACCARQSEMA